MKKLILIIFFTFSLTISFSQSERIEIKLQNCTYEQIPDNGKELKDEIKEFEAYLVKKKILDDNTGKSYINLYKKIEKENEVQFDYNYSFTDSIQKIIITDVHKQMNCQVDLINSEDYTNTKVYKLQVVIDSIKIAGAINPSNIAGGVLSVLDEKDFKLDYYKIKTFVLLDATNTTSEITQTLVKEDKTNSDKALKIYLDKKSRIFIQGKSAGIKKLRKLVRGYEAKNKSESIIVLKVERETMYRVYVDVQHAIAEEINSLREKFSQKKYKTEYEKLTEVQASEINKVYPKKIVEQ